ncbi:histidinol-phosphate aminotransferase [Paenibacillus sp. J31TS4]|uniref:histidinol-phosphate transaminase n=1 Tax=Paenibacillus sp. J31TS4 TaxID=2807195 RepID=UPI001B25B6AE|nr:histidinol-phosphate transaminase [Paenibacillus sp. J31TS4]GIP37457.1 histidinol-phosphate aminotransferase [Paenibacillus sp. J31TS4]
MQPKQNIVHLPVYQPGKPIEDVKRELGLTEVIKLASNENPFGCSPNAKEAILSEMGNLSLYPDGAAVSLSEVVAEHYGVRKDQLIFGAGSDELILLIARAYFERGDETVMAETTFPQYKHNAEVEGAVCIEVPLQDGKHDLNGMLARVNEKTKIVWICNPNNPTGTMLTQAEVEAFLAKVPSRVLVVLDEAYAEFNMTDEYPDGVKLLNAYPNLILLRTFSKIHGLASLRIGYGIAMPEVIRSINQVREPFNTGRMAQAAAKAALLDKEFVEKCRQANAEGIRYLNEQCDRLGLSYYPAHGNFVMIDVKRPADEVFNGLLRRGMIVRSDKGWGLPTRIRVTVGSREQNEKFIQYLEEVLAEVPEAAVQA